MIEHDTTQPQHEVQRLLGRCLLRIQQYEKLAKLTLAHHELSVSPGQDIQTLTEERAQETATNTLGLLTTKLMASFVVRDDPQPDNMDEASTVSIRHKISMSPECHERTEATLKRMVIMRNTLVHHFIDHYDIWTAEGCVAAQSYLQDCYALVNEHVEELRAWANSITTARQAITAFVQSPAFSDLILNGIAPDGTVDWPAAGIVRALRESAAQFGCDGWTSLDTARDWISRQDAEQVPEKYGCRTWPQLLNESRLFTLKYRDDDVTGKPTLWFQERLPKTTKPTRH